jgi:integrase
VQPNDFDDFAVIYARRKRRQTGAEPAESTVYGKCLQLARAARLMECRDQLSLGRVLQNRSQVEDLLDRLAVKMTPGSMRGPVYALLDFAEYARGQGWIDSCALVPGDIPPPNPQKPIVVYSRDEVEQFIAASRGKGLRWWALITFVADTGRRIGECLSLKWEWYRPDGTPPYFELPVTKTGDPQYVPVTRRIREQVLTPEVIATLKAETRNGRRQFARSPLIHPFPMTYASVHTMFDVFCRTTALPNRGIHGFRHSLITHRLEDGIPIEVVSRLAGHSAISTTDRFYNHAQVLNMWKFIEPPENPG